MTQHLTPDLIAEALERDRIEADFPFTGVRGDNITFDHRSGGRVIVTLWRWDEDKAHDVEVECRTFRIVEVES